MEKVYQVYSIDICFSSYAMESILVGAESKEDLICHLGNFIEKRKDRKRIENEGEWRINVVEHLYTDIPYTVIDSYSYYE